MEESVALRAHAPTRPEVPRPAAAPERASGRVLWFSDAKGYGYIVMTDGRRVFVRFSAIDTPGLFKSLDAGQDVTFRVEDDGRGPVTADVRTT